jgi:sulfatase modifying factor 1
VIERVLISCASALVLLSCLSAIAAERPATRPAITLDLGGGVTLKLVDIPPGKFMMGSPEMEKDRGKDEKQHAVTISKAFYMGVTDVTVDQFAAFVKESGYTTDAEKTGNDENRKARGHSWRDPGFEQKGNHPVVNVSWNDAHAFCDWLSRKSGKKVTLPTEARWEYACRAGTTTTFFWGDDREAGQGWLNARDQSCRKVVLFTPAQWLWTSWDDGFPYTSPVDTFKPNPFGLYDMAGNVYQWCEDRYGDYDESKAVDPIGSETGGVRVLRGGCWFGSLIRCRPANRNWNDAAAWTTYFGFRVTVLPAGAE